MIAAGVAVAVLAASCYEIAYVVQARAARLQDDDRLSPSLVGRLVRSRSWIAGLALSGLGAALHVAALTLAPLTVVQPTLALGLVLLLVLAPNVLGEHSGRREAAGVAVIVMGVVACTLAAPPHDGTPSRDAGLAALLSGLALLTLMPFALRDRLRDARLRVGAAAAGDALAALALKLLADAIDAGQWGAAVGWGVTAAIAAGLALTAEMSALQRLAATHVAPVVVAAQVLIPVATAPLLLGERWGDTALGGAVLGAAVLLVAGGAAVLGSSDPVAGRLAARGGPRPREHHVGG